MNPLIHNNNLHAEDNPMTRFAQAATVLFLTAALLAVGCIGTARAEEMSRAADPASDAARLVEDVLRKAGTDGEGSLGAWTRSILDRVLERAGETARQTAPGSPLSSAPPLPAERHAGDLSGPRSDTAEILIFTSLSVACLRAGGSGRARRPGPARRWFCAASAKAGCLRRRRKSATASAAMTRGSPSIRASSACSA